MTTGSTDEESYLTIQEAAKKLRLHEETVRRHLRSGQLEGDYVGRRWRVYPSKLIAFKKKQTEQHKQEMEASDELSPRLSRA